MGLRISLLRGREKYFASAGDRNREGMRSRLAVTDLILSAFVLLCAGAEREREREGERKS
jgi:hypothetical protein